MPAAAPSHGDRNVTGRILLVGVLLLIGVAPLERKEPVSSVAGLQFTNVEVAIILVMIVAVAAFLLERRTPRMGTPLTLPVVVLLAVMIASAFTEQELLGHSARFIGRFFAGFLIFILVHNGVRKRSHLRLVLLVSASVGVLTGLLAVAESFEPQMIAPWLTPYRLDTFWATNQPRATATLGYPTIAAMYLEIAFGMTLGLLFQSGARRWSDSKVLLVLLGLAVIAEGVIVTLTRTGIAVVLVLPLLAGAVWVCRTGDRKALLPLASIISITVLLVGLQVVRYPQFWLRFQAADPARWYQASFQVPDRFNLPGGGHRRVPVRVTNSGLADWSPDGRNAFALSYHWLDPESGDVIEFEGLRTALPQRVRPGETVDLVARVDAPANPGEYLLVWDVVQENRLWFTYEGSSPATSLVKVLPSGDFDGSQPLRVPDHKLSVPSPFQLATDYDPGRAELWRLALQMFVSNPFLGVGPDNFRMLYGDYAHIPKWDKRLHANNLYLEILATLGLAGAAAFLWLLIRIFVLAWSVFSKLEDGGDVGLFLGVCAPLAGFFLHGLLDYFLEFTSIYIVFWLLLGLLTASSRIFEKQESTEAASEVDLTNRQVSPEQWKTSNADR